MDLRPISYTLSNGKLVNAYLVNGVCYDVNTPAPVIDYLERSRRSKERIRVFYGDPVTGEDWEEDNDVTGVVGNSTGQYKIPILVKRANSTGGSAILTHSIVRLFYGHKEVYRHPNYHNCGFQLKCDPSVAHLPFAVGGVKKGQPHIAARFDNEAKAKRWAAFMRGERMVR